MKITMLSKMAWQGFLNLALLASSLVFVLQSCKEYMQGSTSYSETTESLTLHDLPTLVICFLRTDGMDVISNEDDFSIDITIPKITENGSETVTLEKNRYVKTLHNLELQLSQSKLVKREVGLIHVPAQRVIHLA